MQLHFMHREQIGKLFNTEKLSLNATMRLSPVVMAAEVTQKINTITHRITQKLAT